MDDFSRLIEVAPDIEFDESTGLFKVRIKAPHPECGVTRVVGTLHATPRVLKTIERRIKGASESFDTAMDRRGQVLDMRNRTGC